MNMVLNQYKVNLCLDPITSKIHNLSYCVDYIIFIFLTQIPFIHDADHAENTMVMTNLEIIDTWRHKIHSRKVSFTSAAISGILRMESILSIVQ